MRKNIDIPDEIIKDLKIIAIKSDNDLKNYIQNLILNHHNLFTKTELAEYALMDGQKHRPFWNYLVETYADIKNESFVFEQKGNQKFNNLIQFLEHISETCQWAIKSIQEDDDFDPNY